MDSVVKEFIKAKCGHNRDKKHPEFENNFI